MSVYSLSGYREWSGDTPNPRNVTYFSTGEWGTYDEPSNEWPCFCYKGTYLENCIHKLHTTLNIMTVTLSYIETYLKRKILQRNFKDFIDKPLIHVATLKC